MALFGRNRRQRAQADLDAIPLLWQWWMTEGRALADTALADGNWRAFPALVSERVRAIHPGLEWETTPGTTTQHALVLSAAGSPLLRPLTERCVRAAPAADDVWEFHGARQPTRGWSTAVLRLGRGEPLPLEHIEVALHVDDDRERVDVVVHHPAFERLRTKDRLRVACLVLDWQLGEDDVERWIGRVGAESVRPPDALPPVALSETVAALAERVGDDTWVLGRGELRGKPLVFSARRPLTWIDHPLRDRHLAVHLPYAGRRDNGLPDDAALDTLRQFEDVLEEQVGDRALLVAHASTDGVRTLHFYADGTDPGVEQLVRSAAARWPGAGVEAADDPGWSDVAVYA